MKHFESSMEDSAVANAERERLRESRQSLLPWKKWGPYLSERQ
jgi:hypothetical protein